MISIQTYLLLTIIGFELNVISGAEYVQHFCDNTYRDSLLALGGILSIDDMIFATRSARMSANHTIVWRFKLKPIGNQLRITSMSSIPIKHLFPDVTFEYFVSGFAISGDAIDDSNTSCSDGRQQCVDELSNKSRLTLILGPKRDNSSPQQYRTYRFNGREFDTNVADIPLGLERNGTTNKWFTPSALITGTYRQKHKQIIAINYNEKSINRLNVLELSSRHGVIGNRYWEPVVHYLDIKSHYYHLIDIKVSSSERQTLLITEQMVYQLMDNNTLRELMHPWQLFGCESLAHSVSLRSGSDGGHGSDGQQLNQKLLAGEGVRLNTFGHLDRVLIIEFIVANIIYAFIYSLCLIFINRISL